jgi:hypothetical protein
MKHSESRRANTRDGAVANLRELQRVFSPLYKASTQLLSRSVHQNNSQLKLILSVSRLACAFVVTLPGSLAAQRLGVHGSNNTWQGILEFEAWLGRPVDDIQCTVSWHSWEAYKSVGWLHTPDRFANRGSRRMIYATPIIIKDGASSYAQAKDGVYDLYWKSLANSIISHNGGNTETHEIVLRPSHEMNGDWFAWGIGPKPTETAIADFIASWRRFHSVFRRAPGGRRFRFCFSPTEGASCDPRPLWPGDEYVDIVGHDIYWDPKLKGGWETNDAAVAWDKRVGSNPYDGWRIGSMLEFAKAHGKLFQVDVWGVHGPDAEPFINGMAALIKANKDFIRSHSYWNCDSSYVGRLENRDDVWPRTTACFKANFGKAIGNGMAPGRETAIIAVENGRARSEEKPAP